MSKQKTITLNVNGRAEQTTVHAHRTLLEALRGLGHVDIKCGCEKGDCGACAVLLDGRAVDSCLTLAWLAEGREITTVAGLGSGAEMHPLQQAFCDLGAAQCGYCIPGIVLTARVLLEQNPTPTRADIREAIAGNICRCTGYVQIVDAIELAAKQLHE